MRLRRQADASALKRATTSGSPGPRWSDASRRGLVAGSQPRKWFLYQRTDIQICEEILSCAPMPLVPAHRISIFVGIRGREATPGGPSAVSAIAARERPAVKSQVRISRNRP